MLIEINIVAKCKINIKNFCIKQALPRRYINIMQFSYSTRKFLKHFIKINNKCITLSSVNIFE